MAFNSLMIRLTAEALAYLPAHPTIIELGNQTFKPRGNILREIENYLGGAGSNGDIDGLRKFTGGAAPRDRRVDRGLPEGHRLQCLRVYRRQ
jgi:hypothetical protein